MRALGFIALGILSLCALVLTVLMAGGEARQDERDELERLRKRGAL